MKKSLKTSLIVVALVLLASLVSIVWLASRPEQLGELVEESIPETSPGPSFEVRVIVPRLARPLGGLLPDWIVKKMDGTPGELRLDHRSSGAEIGSVGNNHVELRADGWDFLIKTDGEGRVAPETRLVFPLALGGRHVRLNCRPADPADGYLRTTTRAGSNQFAGRFVVELATCKNAESGESVEWPASPLTVRGRFVGPAQGFNK
jgi:hypothetical protein